MDADLSQKRALVVGAGGLGGPALLTLASAGVGRLVLVDDDAVETSNLHRQPLFGERDLGRRKAEAAAARLARLFPGVQVEARDERFGPATAGALVREADVLLDASDGFETRFLASDTALVEGRPLVHGAVLRYTVHLLTVLPGRTGCLRCLFEGPPAPGEVPSCAEAGVLGPVAGLAGALMGAEAVRLLAGGAPAHAGRLLVYEARSARARVVTVATRPDCPACAAVAHAVPPLAGPAPEPRPQAESPGPGGGAVA